MNQSSTRSFFFLFAVAGFALGVLVGGMTKGDVPESRVPSLSAFQSAWSASISGSVESIDEDVLVLLRNDTSLVIQLLDSVSVTQLQFAETGQVSAVAASIEDIQAGDEVTVLIELQEKTIAASEIQILPLPPPAPALSE